MSFDHLGEAGHLVGPVTDQEPVPIGVEARIDLLLPENAGRATTVPSTIVGVSVVSSETTCP